jgi:hypothetical protein
MMNWKYLGLILSITVIFTSCGSDDKHSLKYRILESSSVIEDTAYYSIKLEYPVFIVEDEDLQSLDTLNNTIEQFLDTAAAYYWGTDPDSVKFIIDETETAGKYVLDNKSEILDTTNQLISLKMETYSYALGAHGFIAIHTWNFDIETGKFLRLDDLLDLSDSTKVTALNNLLLQNFENPEDCFNENPVADGSFELFGLEPEYMVFYYEAYELGAYYCGMATVRIPYEALKEAGLWKEYGNQIIAMKQ